MDNDVLKNSMIHHIGILVSSLEKGREFYGEILGFTEIERPKFNIPGVWYQVGACQLHLMLVEDFQRPQHHPQSLTVQQHFSFSVPQYQFHDVIYFLKKKKITFIEEPTKNHAGIYQAFVYDFDGNMIELIEVKL